MIPSPSPDLHDRKLLDEVHPPDWRNPAPKAAYDLVVLGGGTAGLVTAVGAAGLGARVALVERHRLGGDCLNTGCVPSKSLLASAHAAAVARRFDALGLGPSGIPPVDFPRVMERLRRIRAGIAPHDGARRLTGLGIDVFLGQARFRDDRHVTVDGTPVPFRRAVIATGARPSLPRIPGLSEAGPLTSDTVFQLTDLPRRLAVIGGGPIGCELAQAFARLGSEVTLLHSRDRLLDREDPDASAIVTTALEADGVRVLLRAQSDAAGISGALRTLRGTAASGPFRLEADAILVAAGRAPNIEDLGLDAVGVDHDPANGVVVDDFLRTTHPRIHACGDVCLRWKFTHAADAAARIVIQNALFALGPIGRRRVSSLNMAWCTYTDPEVAHTGLTPAEARARGIGLDTYTQPYERVDRALTESDTRGFVRIHVARGTDRILGATVVGSNAGDLVSEVSVAMAGGIGLGTLAAVIHPYPTRAEAIRQVGDQYRRTRLTPSTRRLLDLLRRIRR